MELHASHRSWSVVIANQNIESMTWKNGHPKTWIEKTKKSRGECLAPPQHQYSGNPLRCKWCGHQLTQGKE